MRVLVPIIILVVLLAIAGGVIFGFVRTKQKRDAAMTEFYLCETRFNEEQYSNAVRLLESFLQSHPKAEKAGQAYYYLAMSREKLGESALAMPTWSKIIDNYPESPNRAEAYYYLGAHHQELGQNDKAVDYYKTVVNRFSNMPIAAAAWLGMGKILEAEAKDAEAINAYRKVTENHPHTQFAADAERRRGNLNLNRFLKENAVPYEVKRGDSLVKIAGKFHTTPELIKRLSGLTTDMLQLGQVLKVANAEFNILVDLSTYKLYLRSGDAVVKKYNVSIGKAETPTPPGDFKVTDKLIDPVWYSTTPSGAKLPIPAGDPRNELGTRWIGFKPAYGVHGTIEPESIGEAVSNGCVRMRNADVEELYDLVASGTPVRIVAGTN